MAEKYKCLNPVGIQSPVPQQALAPRLDKIDQDITIPLRKRLPADYPNVNWKIKMNYGFSAYLTDEEKKDADAVIAGVIW
jgi:hypothetical protein